MPTGHGARVPRHAMALALFAALAVAWTWPLARYLGTALPGNPGDNFSFVWNFWWMRRALADPALQIFRSDFLFHPFGTTLVDHPHTAAPAFVGATLLAGLSPVAAHNFVLLAFVTANMASAYALAWHLTRRFSPSVLAALVYGLSPYLAAHLHGHFDLMAAWVLPLFALLLHVALARGSRAAAAGAGLVAVVTAYTTYYYVVYLALLAAVYLVAWLRPLKRIHAGNAPSPARATAARALAATAIGLAVLSAAIVVTGGTIVRIGPVSVSMLRPQNTLAIAWLFGLAAAIVRWPPRFRRRSIPLPRRNRLLRTAVIVVVVFVAGAAPLLLQAARLIVRGEYVSQAYVWRNVPLGVDVVSPLLGPPRHPLTGAVSQRAYERLGLDAVEAVGWMGVLPLLLLIAIRGSGASVRRGIWLWTAVAAAFGVIALGPILTVAGFDSGLRLPAILLRYVPFVANARMPGRAMVGVFLALATLLALRLSTARGWLARPALQWLAIAVIAFEYWDAPIPVTPLARSRVYEALAAEPDGGVCEVPFGIGDGLSAGVGSQDRRALYYATIHQHPLVGGYLGRMPADAEDRYRRTPVVATLLALSSGGRPEADVPAGSPAESPCRYLVLHRSAGDSLRAYVAALPTELIIADEDAALYRLAPK